MREYFRSTENLVIDLLSGLVLGQLWIAFKHFHNKANGDIIITSMLFLLAFFLFSRLNIKPKLKWVFIPVLAILALFLYQAYFWFYSHTDALLVLVYGSALLIAAASGIQKEESQKKHIFPSLGMVTFGMLLVQAIPQLSYNLVFFCLSLMLFTSLFKRHKLVAFVSTLTLVGLSIISFKTQRPVFFEEQKKHEDLVVFTSQTQFNKLVITEWKNEYWFYQNGINEFSTIDPWLYYEPFAYPILELANTQKVLVLGGENGMLVDRLSNFVEQIDILPFDKELFGLAKSESIILNANQGSLNSSNVISLEGDPFHFLERSQFEYDVIYIDLPDPVDVFTNQFYTLEFYQLVYGALKEDGFMVTQSGSPYFAQEAFQIIQNTIQASGFTTFAYHNQVLSLGEWSWVVGSKSKESVQLISQLKASDFNPYNTEWLNQEAMQMMLSYGKTSLQNEGQVNSIKEPILFKSYLKGNFNLN